MYWLVYNFLGFSSKAANTFEYSRFATVFNHDEDSLPRVWTGKEDIRTITRDARVAVIFKYSYGTIGASKLDMVQYINVYIIFYLNSL